MSAQPVDLNRLQDIPEEYATRLLAMQIIEWRLEQIDVKLKEHKAAEDKRIEADRVKMLEIDRLKVAEDRRDKQMGRLWMAVITAMLSVIAGLVLYALTNDK